MNKIKYIEEQINQIFDYLDDLKILLNTMELRLNNLESTKETDDAESVSEF